MHHSIY